MIIQIQKSDILKGQPIKPGWYKGKIEKVSTEVNGERVDGSITLSFDDPLLKADDRQVDHGFYNMIGKGIGFLVPYMAAIMNKSAKEIADALETGASIAFDFDACAGKQIQFKLINDTYQGRVINKIEAFLPYNMETPLG